jgi:hypothetical protein
MHVHTNVVTLYPPGGTPGPRPEIHNLARPSLPALASNDVHMAEIARRLGIADEAWRTIIAKIRLLNGRYGFPAPRNPRIVKGVMRTGPDAIIRRSLFPRARVEEWFDNHRSPSQGAAEDASEAKVAAAQLSTNSRALVAQMSAKAASC